MSLDDAAITTLCKCFRMRAHIFRNEAKQSFDTEDVVRLTAMASTLEWAARELSGYVESEDSAEKPAQPP